MNQLLLTVVCAVGASYISFLANPQEIVRKAYLFKCIYLPFALSSFLFALELLPYIGLFAITLQKMLSTIMKFGFIVLFIEVVFFIFFDSFIAGILHHDASLPQQFYYLFLVLTGSVNFGTEPPIHIMVGHFLYYAFTTILLINYLIAAMSSELINDSGTGELIRSLRKTSACFEVEDSLVFWLNWIRKKYFGFEPKLLLTVSECSHEHSVKAKKRAMQEKFIA